MPPRRRQFAARDGDIRRSHRPSWPRKPVAHQRGIGILQSHLRSGGERAGRAIRDCDGPTPGRHDPSQAERTGASPIVLYPGDLTCWNRWPSEKPEPELAPKYRRTLAEIYVDDAECQAASGDIAAAEASYDASHCADCRSCSRNLARQRLISWSIRRVVWHSRGAMYARLHRYPEAEADLLRALAMPVASAESIRTSRIPGSAAQRAKLIATWLQLSDVYRATHESAEASLGAQASAQCLRSAWPLPRRTFIIARVMRRPWRELAGAMRTTSNSALASDADRKALAAYESLETQYPEIRAYHEERVLVACRLSS